MPVRTRVGRLLTGLLTGRLVAGPRIEDAVRVAAELVNDGRRVALEHIPGPGDDAAAELAALVRQIHAAGLAADCELTLPADRLGAEATVRLVRTAAASGVPVALTGLDVPGTTVVVAAADPGAEALCRAHAPGRVRLTQGRGPAADLAFVRCLNVLMAGDGHPEIGASDRRLIEIAGERAAWNGRTPDSWEYLMPFRIQTDEQHRLVAGGYALRVAVPSGEGAAAVVARRLGGRA